MITFFLLTIVLTFDLTPHSKITLQEWIIISNNDEIQIEIPHATQFKIVVIGDPTVGKTYLVSRFTKRDFEHKPTAGADISYLKIKKGTRETTAIFWDLSGQPAFKQVRPIFYEGAHSIIVCYDVTNKTSAINIAQWAKEAKKLVPGRPFVLIGNKIDLDNREVTEEQGKMFAEKINAPYFECSALKNINVNQAFAEAVKQAVDYRASNK